MPDRNLVGKRNGWGSVINPRDGQSWLDTKRRVASARAHTSGVSSQGRIVRGSSPGQAAIAGSLSSSMRLLALDVDGNGGRENVFIRGPEIPIRLLKAGAWF
jgi:hypothetical protein